MSRLIKVFIFLTAALLLGFIVAISNIGTRVDVYDNAGNLVKTQAGASAGGILLSGLQSEAIPWYISRSSAIAAYVLLFTIVIWGMGMKTGLTYKIVDPARAWQIHQSMSISFGILVVVHAFSLLFDSFIGFNILDILVPFYSSFSPVLLSLGILGFYLLLIVITSSIFIRLSHPRAWRFLHYLVYPLFIFATIHGFFIGTDSSAVLMRMIYFFASSVFAVCFFYRFVIYPRRFKRL